MGLLIPILAIAGPVAVPKREMAPLAFPVPLAGSAAEANRTLANKGGLGHLLGDEAAKTPGQGGYPGSTQGG